MSNTESEDEARNSSDEEWQAQPKKKSMQLRKSVRMIKKAKTYTSSEEDSTLTQAHKVQRNDIKKKRGPKKKIFEKTRSPVQAPTTFTNGAFVVAKTDLQSYDSGTLPHIWRIDGKALLQKFEPIQKKFELVDGKQPIRYKNTSVYTGWSELETDNYAVLKNIDFIYNTPQRVEITLDVQEFKNVLMDSD